MDLNLDSLEIRLPLCPIKPLYGYSATILKYERHMRHIKRAYSSNTPIYVFLTYHVLGHFKPCRKLIFLILIFVEIPSLLE